MFFVTKIPALLIPFINYRLRLQAMSKGKMRQHPFSQIDGFIANQADLDAYQTNPEVDGTVNDYMNLVVQLGFLCLVWP
jgi:hypothetical protein